MTPLLSGIMAQTPLPAWCVVIPATLMALGFLVRSFAPVLRELPPVIRALRREAVNSVPLKLVDNISDALVRGPDTPS